jgi:hypothetical protein
MRLVMVTSVDEVGELLLHLFLVVVEGNLGGSDFSLICVVTMTVMDEVGELLLNLFHVLVEGFDSKNVPHDARILTFRHIS